MKKSVRTSTEEIAHTEQLMNAGKFNEALQLVETIEERSDLTSNDQIACHLLRSALLSKLGQLEDALEIANGAIEESQKLESHLQMVDALLIVSEILWRLGRPDESLEAVEQGEQMLHTISREQTSELMQREAALIDRKGTIYQWKGQFDQALECHKRSLTLFEEIGIKQGIATSLFNIGVIHWRNGELDRALQSFEQSLVLREEIGNKHDIAICLNAIGVIYRRKGDYNQALEYYKRSLVLKEEIGNKQQISMTLNNIGVVYRRRGDLDLALEYLERSMALKEEFGNKENIALSLLNIGHIYRDKGELDTALVYLHRSLGLREEVANNLHRSETLFSLITIAIDKKLMEQARWYLERLVEIDNLDYNKTIRQRYRIAEALVLKTSSRSRDKEKAKKLLSWVIEEEKVDDELTLTALLNFYDLVLADLKASGDQQAFEEVRILVNRLSEVAHKQLSFASLAETYLLKSELALLELDLREARRLLTKGQLIADERGLRRLAMIISSEHDSLLEESNKWDELIERGAPLVERAMLVSLQAVAMDIIRKRGASQLELLEDEPVFLSILHINEGNTIFHKSFLSVEKEDFPIIVEKTSDELSSQSLNRARLNEYTLLIQSEDPFHVCYVYKGQSYIAQQKLAQFTRSLSTTHSLWTALNGVIKHGKGLKHSDQTALEALINENFF